MTRFSPGGGGGTNLTFDSSPGRIFSILFQSDTNFLVANNDNGTLRRYNLSNTVATLDTSFAQGGIATNAGAFGLAADSDGNLYLGLFSSSGRIIKLSANGALRDTNFITTAALSEPMQIAVGPGARTGTATPVATGVFPAGHAVDFQVKFTENVFVTGVPQIALTIGGVPVAASYVSGGGSKVLVFRYTVGSTDNGPFAVTSPIALNGGTIRDGAGTARCSRFRPGPTTV